MNFYEQKLKKYIFKSFEVQIRNFVYNRNKNKYIYI